MQQQLSRLQWRSNESTSQIVVVLRGYRQVAPNYTLKPYIHGTGSYVFKLTAHLRMLCYASIVFSLYLSWSRAPIPVGEPCSSLTDLPPPAPPEHQGILKQMGSVIPAACPTSATGYLPELDRKEKPIIYLNCLFSKQCCRGILQSFPQA